MIAERKIDEISSNYPKEIYDPHGYTEFDFEESIRRRCTYIDQNTVNDAIASQQSSTNQQQLAQNKGFLAPVNMPGAYDVQHPNAQNNPIEEQDNVNDGPFDAGDCLPGATDNCINCDLPSLTTSAMKQDITPQVAARGIADYNRLFSGYDILSCLLYTSPSPRDRQKSRMPSSA